MKKTFTIGEISDLLGIPKSTLRYWDSIGLINLGRNEENNYREYSLSTVYTISDLAYYRNLKMPLADMKKLPELTPDELEVSLSNLDNNLNDEIQRLEKAKKYLEIRFQHIQEYKRLCQAPFAVKLPNFEKIHSFPYYDKASWKVSIKNPYEYALYYDEKIDKIQSGLIESTSPGCYPIWESDVKNKQYLAFPLKVDYSDPSSFNYESSLSKLKEMELTVSCIIARYLFSACEEKQYDYYAAYAEII
jgi:DNA-binding transcriptional MerR regulator